MGLEATALDKQPCPSCGAAADWHPARQALVCPYCGTTAPGRLEEARDGQARIVEHDLVQALRAIPESARGWQAAKTSVRCHTCRAISVFDAERVAQRCDFCGSPALLAYEDVKDPFRPESLLPLKVNESRARDLIRGWYGRVWFAPGALKRRALTDTVHGVYLPYWTFDARVHADWRAESGYHSYTEENVSTAGGKVERRRVRHTRWEPSRGSLDHFFDDQLVPASVGIPAELLRRIEPFPTGELVPYDSGYLSGWVVERYQIDLVKAAERSREAMRRAVESLCAARVPGDTHRNLQVSASFSAQTFKHVLVPVWLLGYTYGARTFQVAINGYTGKIAGNHPWSLTKIALTVLGALALVWALLALLGGG